MTVFVTGGAGFIGSELVRQLIAAGEPVVNIDKLTYAGSMDAVQEVAGSPLYRFARADVCDGARMHALFAEHRPQTVFHLAAESHVDRSIDDPQVFVRTNIGGTAALLEAARAYLRPLAPSKRDAFRFVQVSTDEVYGELGPAGVFGESSPYRPSSPYSACKAAADHLARAWCRTYGLPVIVSGCCNNYGPFQHPEKLIPSTIRRALEGRPLPVYGEGLQVRDWLHVADHAAALRQVAARGQVGGTYLAGARNEWRNIDLVKRICAELDRCRPADAPHARLIEFVADRPGHDARYGVDPHRLETELGWRARTPFDDGLAQTVAWYAGHAGWCARMSADAAGAAHDGPG